MREEEAKEKWCPMTQVSVASVEVSNRGNFVSTYKCLGSSCMWWENKGYENNINYGTCGANK